MATSVPVATEASTGQGSHAGGASMLAALREATRSQHVALERLLDFPDAFTSRAGYATVLAGLYAVIHPLEAWLQRHAACLPVSLELSRRRRAHLITSDLRALGREPGRSKPPAVPLAMLDSPAKLMGCLYVLEGSTLGGQLICRQVLAVHGERARSWLAFFSGHGRHTGRMWRRFERALGDFTGPEYMTDLVAGARLTFDLFTSVLAQRIGAGHGAE